MGTLTDNVAAAIAELRQGRVEFKMDRTGIVHAPIGKAYFDAQALFLNMGALTGALTLTCRCGISTLHCLSGCGPCRPLRPACFKGLLTSGVAFDPAAATPFRFPTCLPAGALLAAKPEAIKGGLAKYVRTAYLASTMGLAVPVDVQSLGDAVTAAAAARSSQKKADVAAARG